MTIPGKELEPISSGAEAIAVKEVEGYIEQVEKKPEIDKQSPLQPAPSQTPTPPSVTDQAGQVMMQPSEPTAAPIHLPLTQPEVQDGLHHQVFDAFRWLAEFCVFLIKKYPGRVFYGSEKEQKS